MCCFLIRNAKRDKIKDIKFDGHVVHHIRCSNELHMVVVINEILSTCSIGSKTPNAARCTYEKKLSPTLKKLNVDLEFIASQPIK